MKGFTRKPEAKKPAAKAKPLPEKPVVKAKAPKAPEPPKPVAVPDEHVEVVAASLLGGFIAASNNALDNSRLVCFLDDALVLARQLIESNRSKKSAS